MTKPLVALVGRQNVGKSTLFNRIVGRRLAIVEDLPGTTRDRLYADAEWQGRVFTVIDTGGLVLGSDDDLLSRVRMQAQQAIADADALVLVTDVLDGITPTDHELAQILRLTQKPILVAANKADNAQRRMEGAEFWALGLGEVHTISALHGTGVADMLDDLVAALPAAEDQAPQEPDTVRIAILGRSNVGKSSLLNALLRQDRAIVSPTAGTTRDAIDTHLTWHGQELVLIDTAGIRKRGKVAPGVEKYSVMRALKALDRAHVALLVTDATSGVTSQDAHIASYILEASKSIVIVVNKWDLMTKDHTTMDSYRQRIRQQLKFIPYAPVIFVSALTHQRIGQVLETALRVHEQRFQRIPTGQLNELVEEAIARHHPPSKAGKRLTFYFATQPRVDPPTLVFFVNDARLVHFSYERYIENRIRERWGFEGTPLRLHFEGHRRANKR